MLNLSRSTGVNKFLPKEKLGRKLSLPPALRESLKNDIKRISIANELSPKTMNIAKGEKIHAVFVMELQLKQKEIDYKLVEALGKQIGQKILFVLRCEDTAQLAIYFGKLYHSDWMKLSAITLDISGANFDEVWDGIVGQIALDKTAATPANTNVSIAEQLAAKSEREKLEREIAALEKKIKKETQFNLQAKMKKELAKLKERLR